MRRLLSLLLIPLALLLAMASPAALPGESEAVAVIVNKSLAISSLSPVELSLIFWRKKLYWADGKRMHPLNLPTDNPLRRQFSQRILGSLPDAQTDYWNDQYFHGNSPPHVVNSQEAMLRYVSESSGAIGYVQGCKVDARVKVVLWLRADGSTSNIAPPLDCAPD
jgi:ABC-type phosphate transport system substrate-binding protein